MSVTTAELPVTANTKSTQDQFIVVYHVKFLFSQEHLFDVDPLFVPRSFQKKVKTKLELIVTATNVIFGNQQLISKQSNRLFTGE